MAYCTNCGEEISEDQQYCSSCGQRLGANDRADRPPEGTGRDPSGATGDWGDDRSGDWGEQSTSGRGGWNAEQRGRSPESPLQVPRKNALDTMVESSSWLAGVPVLIGAFLGVEVLNSAAAFLPPGLSSLVQLIGLVLGLIVGGVAYLFVEYEFRAGAIEIDEAASEVTEQLVSLIGVFIIYAVAVFVGLLLLVLPGIYLGARLFLAFPACVLDKRGVFDSISVSWDVAGGNVLKLIGIFLLSLVPLLLVSVLGAGTGDIETLQNPLFFLVSAPVSAFVTGVVEMSGARVYLENRGGTDTT